MKRLIAVLTALCLLAALAGCAPKAPDPAHETSVAADDFAQDLGAMRVTLQSLVSDHAPPPSAGETDAFPPDDTVVRGKVLSIEGVKAPDGDWTWYVAFVTISVDEVLQGSVEGPTLRAVTAAVTNEEVEWLCDPRVSGLASAQSATFLLRDTAEMTWEILSLTFTVSDLAQYNLVGLA